MRTTNKSRSRSKGNRRVNGNVINRVFESSGPEGKVRGNPQQIIEKYQSLARDAYLTGDRVAGENFSQHSEHYVRILGEAQKQRDQARQEQQNAADDSRPAEPAQEPGAQPYNIKKPAPEVIRMRRVAMGAAPEDAPAAVPE